LLLNVLRDQLDRFGEIDKTAKLLTEVAKHTKTTVVLNREDPLIAAIACSLPRSKTVKYFGYDAKLAGFFPNDDELYGRRTIKKSTAQADVELKSFSANQATFAVEQKSYSARVNITGAHNLLNAAGALALSRAVLGSQADNDILLNTLGKIRAAFGRGEVLNINGKLVELILVKNPSGFRLSLKSQYNKQSDAMIAINDHYADGRDVSWLWDVDFQALSKVALVSGIRASDMALRLQYDEVPLGRVEPDFKTAVDLLLAGSSPKKQIFCTYTAMLKIRKLLSKIDKVERAL
jgi:UDP-N-acetylmuramyl tripeptide synthase